MDAIGKSCLMRYGKYSLTQSRSEWCALKLGQYAICKQMYPFRERSSFRDMIEESMIIPEELYPLPPEVDESAAPSPLDIQSLDELLNQLEVAKVYCKGHKEELVCLDGLIDYIGQLKARYPMTSADEQFEMSYVVRFWWYEGVMFPKSLLERVPREPTAMIVAAYFYAAIIVIPPFFPAMGPMVSYFRDFEDAQLTVVVFWPHWNAPDPRNLDLHGRPTEQSSQCYDV
jgi:hypothetical protein